MQAVAIGVVGICVVIVGLFMFSQQPTGLTTGASITDPMTGDLILPGGETFTEFNGPIEAIDGKPVVRLFSTTGCLHCVWIKETFDQTMKELVAEGKVVAMHWELDQSDDTLTPQKESGVPESEFELFKRFNSRGSVPTYIFGGKYVRVGNAFETRENLVNPTSNDSLRRLGLEKEEFKAVVEKLLKELE